MFKFVKSKAGLTPTDFSRLLGISRVTASLWFNDRAKPHHLLANKLKKLLDAIRAAVEAGDLPSPEGLTREERSAHITKVMSRHLKRAKVDEAA